MANPMATFQALMKQKKDNTGEKGAEASPFAKQKKSGVPPKAKGKGKNPFAKQPKGDMGC